MGICETEVKRGKKKKKGGGSVHALHFGQGKVCLDRVQGWGWGLGDQFGALVGINCTNSNRHLCVWQEKCRSEIINENDIIFFFKLKNSHSTILLICMCSKLINKKQK